MIFVLNLLVLLTGALATLQRGELQALKSQDGVIKLDDSNFFELTTGPRDYYISLLYTAMAQEVGCESCKKFDPIYGKISRSYSASNPGKDGIVFFKADFNDNKAAFGKLQMNQVPRLWVFPPGEDIGYGVLNEHFDYTLAGRAMEDPLHFADFVSKLVNANIVVQEDFEPLQFAQYFVVTFVVVLLLKKKVLSKLPKVALFRMVSTLAIVILTSGYMFTIIRGIPLLSHDANGEIMYFSGGTHWQFGSETFIVASIYLGFVSLFYLLVVFIPRQDSEAKRNTLAICASIGVLWLFSQLTGIYLVKDPSYPYALQRFIPL